MTGAVQSAILATPGLLVNFDVRAIWRSEVIIGLCKTLYVFVPPCTCACCLTYIKIFHEIKVHIKHNSVISTAIADIRLHPSLMLSPGESV